MFVISSFVAGLFVAWVVAWLFVYFSKQRPQKSQLKALEDKLQYSEQACAETTAALNTALEQLHAKVDVLIHQYEVATAEADGLRGELDVVRQANDPDTNRDDATIIEPESLDGDVILEQEFAAALDNPAPGLRGG